MFSFFQPFRLLVAFVLVLAVVGSLWVYQQYRILFVPVTVATEGSNYLYIPNGSDFEDLINSLAKNNFLKDSLSFRKAAALRQYDRGKIRSGRFQIKNGWSNYELINHLRTGEQATVKLVLHNERHPEEVAGKVARYLQPDSSQFLQALRNDSLLDALGTDREKLMTFFIPNTYDFFWNTRPEAFLLRMKREKETFWNQNSRLEKATRLKMTPEEVYTLASIVDRETRIPSEKPRVAGLYLNRLRRGMKLQADPTAVFGTGDFDARRVLSWHIQYDSPYNTYLYQGLPPGPITMASISGIDAVLEAEDHDYLYMCARPDNSGLHAFAKTFAAHQVNANKYRRWLGTLGIFK